MVGAGGHSEVWEKSVLVFGHLMFEMTIAYPSGNVIQAAGNISLEVWGAVWAGNTLGKIHLCLVLKLCDQMRLSS